MLGDEFHEVEIYQDGLYEDGKRVNLNSVPKTAAPETAAFGTSSSCIGSSPARSRALPIQRLWPLAVGGVAAFMAAGCGMSSLPGLTSGLGTSVFGGGSTSKSDVKKVSEDGLLSAAKAGDGTIAPNISAEAGGCPRFVVGQRDATLTIYEPGRVGDGLAILHRGEITKTARECQVEPGRVTIKYGFAGRVLLGPKGKTTSLKLPVNIVVTDAKREKIAVDSVKVDVDVAVEKPIGYFSAVRTVTVPVPEGARPGELEIQIGFDRNVPGAG
jgi:hypothetical protein